MPFTLTGSQVRELRDKARVTQAALADALGKSRRTIVRWERHPERPIPVTQWLPALRFLVSRRQMLRELAAAATTLDNPAKSGVRRQRQRQRKQNRKQ